MKKSGWEMLGVIRREGREDERERVVLGEKLGAKTRTSKQPTILHFARSPQKLPLTTGSSSSSPTHLPGANLGSPMYCTVPLMLFPTSITRWPTFNGGAAIRSNLEMFAPILRNFGYFLFSLLVFSPTCFFLSHSPHPSYPPLSCFFSSS